MYYTMFQNLPHRNDYKLHAFNFRQDGTGTVVVQAVDGNNSDNNLWYIYYLFLHLLNKLL